jgi:hypothetical protein
MTGVRLGTLDGAPCRPNVTDRRATAALDPPLCADVGLSSAGMLASQNRAFWSPAAMIWSPGKPRSSVGYSLIWRMPRALVAGSMIQAAQAKPMSAMPSSVLSPGVS